MSTGAVLGEDIDEVVEATRDAVELARLPQPSGAGLPAGALDGARGASALVDEDGRQAELPPRFVLAAGSDQAGALLDENPRARWLLVEGALPESFLRALLGAARRRKRELTLVVSDPTKVFLSRPRRRLVRAAGHRASRASRERPAGDHRQPRGAAVAPLRLRAAARLLEAGDPGRAGARRARPLLRRLVPAPRPRRRGARRPPRGARPRLSGCSRSTRR